MRGHNVLKTRCITLVFVLLKIDNVSFECSGHGGAGQSGAGSHLRRPRAIAGGHRHRCHCPLQERCRIFSSIYAYVMLLYLPFQT